MHSFEVADKAIGQKVFDTEKRIISGVENLDTMRYIFSFSEKIDFLPSLLKNHYFIFILFFLEISTILHPCSRR